MIKSAKYIESCDRDAACMSESLKNRRIKQLEQPPDYLNKVVLKPWGYEFLVYANETVAVWFLFISKDHATSMHCHPYKKTALSLLSGKALCNTFKHRNFLQAGDSLILKPGVFHSTKAMALDGIFVLEVETPPDKLDLLRLNDGYGRENSGYESVYEMVTDGLDKFNYFYLGDPGSDRGSHVHSMPGRFCISVDTYSGPADFKARFSLDSGAQYCVCRGKLVSDDSRLVLEAGDMEKGTLLSDRKGLTVFSEVTLMKIEIY
jgi:mannose-6-phosphate isomerase-like protein (cupin superfamily)